MKPESFFENFDLLAESPNGIQKLREMILQMAVQGKLVEQDPDDEPADVLLERIRAEKERLVKEKKIKKIKTLDSISSDEIRFDLPSGWAWARVGEIVKKLGAGSTPKGGKSVYQDEGIKFIRSQNVWNEGLKLEHVALISLEIHKKMNGTVVYPRDILLNITGASIGRSSIVSDEFDEGNVSQHVSILRLIDDDICKFIHTCIISPLVQDAIMGAQVGISREGLSMTSLKDFLLPIPPLEEQKRIVAKVDQLMALCDQLESLQQKKNESRIQLNDSALNKMLGAGSPEEFAENWQLVCENFDLLYDDLANVEKLRQAILQLAVQGKLVEQDASDEPAGVLLERIRAEKERLVKEKKIQKSKSSQPIEADETPYTVPEIWSWCRWEDVSLKIGDLDHKMPQECKAGIPYISPKDFTKNNGINFTNAKKVSVEDFERLRKKIQPEIHDLIFPRYGTIGENRYVTIENDFLVSYSCAVIKNLNGLIDPKYSYYYSISPLVKKEIERYINKTTQPNVGLKSIKSFLYPLPPLKEQKNIVAKVDRLMALCDQIEVRIKQAQFDSDVLMEVTVNRLLVA